LNRPATGDVRSSTCPTVIVVEVTPGDAEDDGVVPELAELVALDDVVEVEAPEEQAPRTARSPSEATNPTDVR